MGIFKVVKYQEWLRTQETHLSTYTASGTRGPYPWMATHVRNDDAQVTGKGR